MANGAEDRYLRRLAWLLLPAAFFNGFDSELRALLLPQLQHSFHVGVATMGAASVPIGAGQFVAFLAVRLADRVGRRPILLVSLFGYAVFTGLTVLSTSIWNFAIYQALAQVFIGTEFALAVLVTAEEMPPERRGRALGRLLVAGPLGAVATAGLLATGLAHSELGWRAFYLVGIVPIVLVGIARRSIRETRAFRRAARTRPRATSLAIVLRPPWRRRILALGALSFFQKIPVTAAAGWWVYYAERDRHFSTGVVSLDLAVSYGIGTIGYYVCGRSIDRFGRRPVTTLYLVCGCGFGLALFQSSTEVSTFAFLLPAVFFGLGVGPALSALSAESFPTELRAQASAVVGNGFANAGEVLGPALVGVLGARGAAIGSIGEAASALMVLGLFAVAALWAFVPETNGVRLDEGDPLASLLSPSGRPLRRARRPSAPQGTSTLGTAADEGE